MRHLLIYFFLTVLLVGCDSEANLKSEESKLKGSKDNSEGDYYDSSYPDGTILNRMKVDINGSRSRNDVWIYHDRPIGKELISVVVNKGNRQLAFVSKNKNSGVFEYEYLGAQLRPKLAEIFLKSPKVTLYHIDTKPECIGKDALLRNDWHEDCVYSAVKVPITVNK